MLAERPQRIANRLGVSFSDTQAQEKSQERVKMENFLLEAIYEGLL